MGVFLQIEAYKAEEDFFVPQYNQNVFVRASQLLDLCLMSTESLQFGYHLLAATTISFYVKSIITVTQITALSSEEMESCRNWMVPFLDVLEMGRNASLVCSSFSDIPEELAHNIQTHSVNLVLLTTGSQCNMKI
ncbi:hypothetical protein HELRODRAFT_183545 [Helobdella robusta]|uniref:Uncharacterized protein n=1 Tax=Helobdella robusta TaxID=6412 RepID=T1FJT8_HELRO|nr:hypothetical protein HELRODRAFT_183545 [Helobdella robusta]ESO10515.1 hypothetical protein HELRODRAFT_183545 [Helobdella robusta]